MNVQDVCDAFKRALEVIPDVEVYAHVPSKPVLPALIIYPETVPYPVTQEATFIVWAVAGEVEAQGAQALLADWMADSGLSSIYAAVTADESLGGTISTVLPIQMRNWGVVTLGDGRRVVQAQAVFSVWR